MTCPFCQTDNPEANKFCGQCGASLDPTVGRLQSHLEESIKQEVQRALEARLKDQKLVELETSVAVADRVSNWTKLFASFVGIPLAALAIVLGFLGFHTYNDFAELIRDTRTKITPELDEAKKEADAAATNAKLASKEVQDLGDLAKQTSQSFSEVSKKLAEVSALSSEVDQLKSRAGDVQKQLAEASKISDKVNGLASQVGQIQREVSKIGRVTILTDRPDGLRSLVDYLNSSLWETTVLTTSELAKVSLTGPDIIVVAADTRDSWTKQPQLALRSIFENYKVIAMGSGSQLFSALGLEINAEHVMHMPSGTPLIVEISVLLKSPLPISSSDDVLQVSQSGGDIIGVYDEGSPDIAGFEGIANWKTQPHHWPIARQGNYVFWGFGSSADQLTEDGKRLLVNLMVNHKLHPSIPLSQARKTFQYIQPGTVSYRLTGQFPRSVSHFQVRQPGRITARLSWSPPERQLALILNGPGQTGYFARKDAVSPIEIAFDVTDKNISDGTDWAISAAAFGDLGATLIDYKLELSFPTLVAGPE